jgi:hypothetical protein
MSWYKKFKIVVKDNVDQFKMIGDRDLMIAPTVDSEALSDDSKSQLEEPKLETFPSQDNQQQNPQEFREQLVQNSIEFISSIKPDLENADPSLVEDLNKSFYKQATDKLRATNKFIEQYNIQNPSQRVQIISWNDVGLQGPAAGVMGSLLLPFARSKQNLGSNDPNLPAIINYTKSVLQSNNITDDEAGALMLADYASSNEHNDVRMLVNDYYAKAGRQYFHDLLALVGFPNLAEEFSKIPDKQLNFRENFGKRPTAKVKEDEVFGKDYGLETRSEAERQILSIFRAVDLQPIPAEIKMPSTKVKKGTKDINTEFMCDFLLPCEVLRGWNKDGSPNIESQVVFVGEYFGWYGSDYESKTSMKEELEPFQAVLSGNDVIFISKDDFAAGGNALKLINQLEAKSIIFKGGKTKQSIEIWLSENKDTADKATYQTIEDRTNKLSPELAIIRAAMLQLQFKYGEIAQFYQKYADPENQEYQNLVTSLYSQYKVLKAQSDDLNKKIRALQHRNKIEASNYDWDDTVSKSRNAAEIETLMEQLKQVNYQIRRIYVDNEQVKNIKKSHLDSLLKNPDYQARYAELQTLYDFVEQGKDPLPNEEAPLGRKVAEICNNSLAGLGVSLTRQTKQLPKDFKPMLVTALNKYNKIIYSILNEFKFGN